MNSTEMDEITDLMNAWKVAADKVTSIKAEIATKQQEGAEAADIQSLQDTLTNAQTDENSTKTTLYSTNLRNDQAIRLLTNRQLLWCHLLHNKHQPPTGKLSVRQESLEIRKHAYLQG